jgi:hypothetical protein
VEDLNNKSPRLKRGLIVIEYALSSFFYVAAVVGQITTLREWYKTPDRMSSGKFGKRRSCEMEHIEAGTRDLGLGTELS